MNTNTHSTMKKVLIQIVSKQTLPNVLSILALKPDIVSNHLHQDDSEDKGEAAELAQDTRLRASHQ